MVMPENFRDREKQRFVETQDGETAVRTTIVDSGLIAGKDYDNIAVSYPNDTTETYTYSLSASTVSTITVTYADNTKCEILNVAYA